MEKVRNEVSSGEGKDGVKTIRPIHSNYVAYVKELISLENHDTVKNGKKPFELTGISYSNFAEYETISSADGITVNFTLDKPTNVSLNVMELNGVFVCSTASDKLLESGTHSYTITLERNRQYLVQLILDGRVNVRKIMVK